MGCVTTILIRDERGPWQELSSFLIVVQVAIEKDTLDILGLISTERTRVMVTRAAPLPTTQEKGESVTN
jgi:hypothetical protein